MWQFTLKVNEALWEHFEFRNVTSVKSLLPLLDYSLHYMPAVRQVAIHRGL